MHLQHEIATRLASKEELDNIFLDHIRNFLGLSEKTPYSNQQPTRLETLNRYLTGNRIFNLEDMETLLAMYFDDISAGTEKHPLSRTGAKSQRRRESGCYYPYRPHGRPVRNSRPSRFFSRSALHRKDC